MEKNLLKYVCQPYPQIKLLRLYWANHRDSHKEPSLMSLWWSYFVVHKAHLIGDDMPKLCAAQHRSCCVKFCFISKLPPLSEIIGNKAKRANLQTSVSGKRSTPNFPKNEHFLSPDTHMHVMVRNISFLENLVCFVFLKHPFWDSPIYFITDI